MELRDLKAFVVLGELLHFGQAASRLHITQSALSKQIRRLEDEVGAPLFERNANRTRLTELGRALLADAAQLLDDSLSWLRQAADLQAGRSGSLRIGFGASTHTLLPGLIARFRQQRPQVRITLSDLSSHHQWQAMREGRLDLGFCRLPAPSGWPSLPVVQDCFQAVLPPGYPPDTNLHSLGSLPLVIIRRDLAPAYHDHVQYLLASSALDCRDILPVSDFPAAIALAAAGLGWALIPASASLGGQQVRSILLREEAAVWQIGLIRPPGVAGPLVESFWEMVRQSLPVEPDTK
ncbi:LysR family transcriptional regulator [Aquitalea denitrificans]|uniref:LysR family transcriptional regulator n=1 Tax=Aquitalea denitrificans TaxID=519081 RepID=UPI00135A995C|nr:LysR family transcriptional regulator [Aquitalea denitrificans]